MDSDEDITLLEDPVWTEKYELEEERLQAAGGEGLLGVHHVGSTAIPDVPGKPALDVLAAFDSFEHMDGTAERVQEEHEEFERFSETDTFILVVNWADDHAVFHRMHTMDDEDKIRNQILFRDYLRDHGDARREYEEVKREAVENHADDPDDYTKAKTDVVAGLIQRAEAAGYEGRLPNYLQTSQMTKIDYEGTIDWNQYWNESDNPPDDDANGSMAVVVEPFLEFIDEKGVPDNYADIGCGGGELAVTVAENHPETTVIGYDAAEPVVVTNRHRTDEDGPSNVQFEHSVLPDFDPDRQFELVTAFFTLCYVPEIEPALQALYDAVAPGGHLVINYHNRHAQTLFRTFAQDPHEYLGEDSAWDPNHFADRFELVLDGENLLSYDRIQRTLNTWPQSLWSVVDADRYGAWKQNPLVFIPK